MSRREGLPGGMGDLERWVPWREGRVGGRALFNLIVVGTTYSYLLKFTEPITVIIGEFYL